MKTQLPVAETHPLETAYNNYKTMELLLDQANGRIRDLDIENRSLHAEVRMLRESVERSDKDRRRLQAVSSTFGGQARALSAIFNDIMTLAIKNGIEAAETQPDPDTERAADEVQAILQRVKPEAATQPPGEIMSHAGVAIRSVAVLPQNQW